MQESDEIIKKIKALEEEIRFLWRHVHLQHAHITALRIVAIAKLADSEGVKREEAFTHFEKVIRTVYDEHIGKIENKFPAIAADVDVRSGLSAQEQELWYLASEDFPKPDEGQGDAGEK